MSGPPAGFFESFGAVEAAPLPDFEEITMPRASECTTKETLVTNADGTKSIQRTRVYTASDGTVTTKTDSKPLGGEYPSSDGDGDGDAAVAEMQAVLDEPLGATESTTAPDLTPASGPGETDP
tara:strand:+ start:120 stop:488 length:369 start_codon:yes stop_codon:yes gene_type:complete